MAWELLVAEIPHKPRYILRFIQKPSINDVHIYTLLHTVIGISLERSIFPKRVSVNRVQ